LSSATISCVSAQDRINHDKFPDRPVRVVVPYGAGGAADILARIMAERLSHIWQQQVIVENKPGGVGTIGIMSVVQSPPDGYTLVSVPVSDLAVNPYLYKNRAFSIEKDLAPVSQVGAVPNVLVASNSSGIKSIKALIELARQQPGKLTYSSPGVGSQAHLAAEILGAKADVSLMHVPYNSVSAALTEVAGGHVDLMFVQLPAALPFIESKRVTALAMASEKQSPLFPSLRTWVEETGLELGDAVSWSGLMAPAGTPLEIRQKIAQAVTEAMRAPAMQERLAKMGTEGRGGTPEELNAAIRQDADRYSAIIQALGLRLD